MESYHKNSDNTIALINSTYDKAIRDINKDINKIFYKYQLGSKLTSKEARELLNSNISKKELEDIRRKIKQIQDDGIKAFLMAKLNSKAYKARITRLEAIRESIYINSKIIADIEKRASTLGYIDNINNAYYHSMYDIQKGTGLAFNFSTMHATLIEEILKNKWSGKHYSKRIWNNTDILAEKLGETVTAGLMSGKNSRRMAAELEELTQYGKHAAERLVRTETTYITNQAEIASYKECKIDKYVFVATLDLRTSLLCREHDKKVYEVLKAVSGINLPPLHPYCRSVTIAYFGEETINNLKRLARDPKTGKTYLLDKNIGYEEWYKKYVIDKYGERKTKMFEKMIKNKSSDRKQYKQYKKVLGKESPETLEDFQNIKYNEVSKWEELKKDYSKTVRFNRIVQESTDLHIKGEVIKYIDRIDITDYKFADTHINSERNHNVSKEMAQNYIDESVVAYSRWKGQVVVYVSEGGCSVVNLENKIISTAYKSEEYDEKFKKILEVVKDNG